MVVDCTSAMCLPVEIFGIFVGISIFIGIVGFVRQPQIPAMLAMGGIMLFFISIITNGMILGVIPDSSTTAGATTTYDMEDNVFDFTGLPQIFGALTGVIMMLYGAISVFSKKDG